MKYICQAISRQEMCIRDSNNPAEAPETIELEGVTYKIYKATKGGEFIGAAVESSAGLLSNPGTRCV